MNKVYATSDWHGADIELIYQVFNFLDPNDKLYFLGDAIDRGEYGYENLKRLLLDPRVIFIKGNHEELMQLALPSLVEIDDACQVGFSQNVNLWFYNGGIETWKMLQKENIENIKKIYKAIKRLPSAAEYTSPLGHNVILEHAGYTPNIILNHHHDPCWDREHFNDNWDEYHFPKTYLVHGHTPVQYLKFEYGYKDAPVLTKEEMKRKEKWWETFTPTIIRYCNNHKFDIDMCTIASKRIALLDLDSFEVKYFDKEKENGCSS